MKSTLKLREKKQSAWDFAFGLIKYDNLEPSPFLRELAKMEVDGKITTNEIKGLLLKKYKVIE